MIPVCESCSRFRVVIAAAFGFGIETGPLPSDDYLIERLENLKVARLLLTEGSGRPLPSIRFEVQE